MKRCRPPSSWRRRESTAEVIDLASLSPIDHDTILESVAHTGRLVIVHEAARNAGLGAEIAATVAEQGAVRPAGADRARHRLRHRDALLRAGTRVHSQRRTHRRRRATDTPGLTDSTMTRFNLPDLGEGLQEAEIVRWHVAVGDQVKVDQPMVAVETAKAIVEVPSPFDGTIVALHGKPGDTIGTGAPLVDFLLATAPAQRDCTPRPEFPRAASSAACPRATSMIQGAAAGAPRQVFRRARAVPAARDLARRLNIDLDGVLRKRPRRIDHARRRAEGVDAGSLDASAAAHPGRHQLDAAGDRSASSPARSRYCAACDAPWRRA